MVVSPISDYETDNVSDNDSGSDDIELKSDMPIGSKHVSGFFRPMVISDVLADFLHAADNTFVRDRLPFWPTQPFWFERNHTMTNPAGELLTEAVAEGRIKLKWDIQVLSLGELTRSEAIAS